jgi:hypothetical protein
MLEKNQKNYGRRLRKKLDSIGKFNEGVAVAKKGKHHFHINNFYERIYKENYQWAEPFYKGVAKVGKDSETLFINLKGKVLFGC